MQSKVLLGGGWIKLDLVKKTKVVFWTRQMKQWNCSHSKQKKGQEGNLLKKRCGLHRVVALSRLQQDSHSVTSALLMLGGGGDVKVLLATTTDATATMQRWFNCRFVCASSCRNVCVGEWLPDVDTWNCLTLQLEAELGGQGGGANHTMPWLRLVLTEGGVGTSAARQNVGRIQDVAPKSLQF